MDQVGQGPPLPSKLSPEREKHFPNLPDAGYQVTSHESTRYNCIAYAAGDLQNKWDPLPLDPGYYWPPGANRGMSIDCLSSAFEAIGYQKCLDGQLEQGYEKVALYVDPQGEWSHAAIQLQDGHWSSKLGIWEDIRHPTPHAVNGPGYGQIFQYMKRKI